MPTRTTHSVRCVLDWPATPAAAPAVAKVVQDRLGHATAVFTLDRYSHVAAGMQHLKRRGVDRIELEVDSENNAARELYLKLGFRKDRETVWFEKQLAKG